MSLSMLTFRADTKFIYEGIPGRRKNRRGRGLRRSTQVIPALPADVDNEENDKKSRGKFRPALTMSAVVSGITISPPSRSDSTNRTS
jgi:hypothetical protein